MSDFIQSLADVIPSHLRKEVERELRFGWNQQEIKAKSEAKQLAIFGHANEARALDGVGEMVARIPRSAFHYWGQRLGYECWEDKQFRKEFIRDNPEVAVRNRMKRTCVNGYSGLFDSSGTLTK